tara:strand:+ start:1052 stop:1225 length:174 start_codon:yes stop_codon:yes gene_type:complete
MYRTIFYYKEKEDSVRKILGVKHCIRPRATKMYKYLQKKQDQDKYHTIGWSREEINY